MSGRIFPSFAVLLVLVAACRPGAMAPPSAPDAYDEADVATLQAAMETGDLTARRLVDYYLERIAAIDQAGPELRSIIEINPDARAIADSLDAERRRQGPRGPLHGIPVVLKANIDTGDSLATSAGSLALAGHYAPDDAFLVRQLRDAGAIILGKTNLSEWANFRSSRSSSGWSSLGGQTKNPYDVLRNPCGSSSGSGVAISANLAVLAVGTETDGSIVCPAGINGIVGFKPTLGLVSRDGIIPIAHSQDTAGPMTRTVRDAALMLAAMDAVDPKDPATAERPAAEFDYVAALREDALQGARIGVIRTFYGSGGNPFVDEILLQVIETLRTAGAVVIDSISIDTEGMGNAEGDVLRFEFRPDLEKYLAESQAPYRTLDELIDFNDTHADDVMPFFGQETFIASRDMPPLSDPAYLEALATSKRIARTGIDGALAAHGLDALVVPTNDPSWMTDHVNGDHFTASSSDFAAVSGYPSITVPAGQVFGLPVGISFVGGAWKDAALIGLAFAYEQASHARRAPILP